MCGETSEDVTNMNVYDETSGELFNQRLVRGAEDEELHRFKKMAVYDYMDRQTAHQDGEGIFVKVRWVRVNKGTKTNPHLKYRLVAWSQDGRALRKYPMSQFYQVSNIVRCQERKRPETDEFGLQKSHFCMEPRAETSTLSYPVRTLSTGVTRSGCSAKRCTVRVMLLRSGNLKFEGRWKILVFDDARCSRPCIPGVSLVRTFFNA